MTDLKRGWYWVPTLYFAEGLPYVVVITLAGLMYTSMGVSNSAMAFFTSWLMLPWLVKPLWSPLVDVISSKRKWVVAMQLLLAGGLGCVGFLLPGPHYFRFTMAVFFIIAFLSATHDIAADGMYLISLDAKGQSFFVGIRTTFYRLAMLFCQGPVVTLAGYLSRRTGSMSDAWMWTFYGLSVMFLIIAVYNAIAMPRSASAQSPEYSGNTLQRVRMVLGKFGDAFGTFFKKPSVLLAIVFMMLYKLPEAQLIKLINPFLLHSRADGGLGLSVEDVGIVYGTVGVIGLLLGGITGGWVVSWGGLRRWMMPMAWSMSLTCLSFVYLSMAPGSSLPVIAGCVFIEQFGYGFGGTAYILYLMDFSSGRFATSHYAICTGFMTLGTMLPGMAAGWIQEQTGYLWFFIWTVACCAVTISVAYLSLRTLKGTR